MKLLKCEKCGNVIDILEDKTTNISCCGEKMQELKANTSDGAKEKHVPYCQIEDDIVRVKVGEVAHPMDDNHYITCVIAEYSDSNIKYSFRPGDEIEVVFDYEKGMKVYAYCNLHGLWMKEL